MRWIQLLFILLVFLGLAGCHDDHRRQPKVYREVPELLGFHIVDSFGVSSELSSEGLFELDPFTADGWFELYWYVDSFYDYRVTLTLNDRPTPSGGVVIGRDYCGYDLGCDDTGLQVCHYAEDYYLGCGIDPDDALDRETDIYALYDRVPDNLYFNIEVCDVDRLACEISSLPVKML